MHFCRDLSPEEGSRGKNRTEAAITQEQGSKRLPTSSSDPSPCTCQTQSVPNPTHLPPSPLLGRLAPPLSDTLAQHQRQLLGVTCNLPHPQALARLSPGSAIPSSCLVFCNISSSIFPLPVLPLQPFIHPEAKVFLTHLAALPLALGTFQ